MLARVSAGVGLRERKKQQTRELIADTARSLFAERGFDDVTVADVARAADVSEVTVFNYFPTKEDLFFGRMQFFEETLIEGVRERAHGDSAVEAFQRLLIEGSKRLVADETDDLIATAARLIAASPNLQAREREISARYTRNLADLLAEETGAAAGDPEVLGVAAALMGVHRALVAYVRNSVLAGRRGTRLAADMRAQAARAFARLEGGFAGYAIKA